MVLPFAAWSLLAKGVMPALSPNGVVMLVICTGDGMVEMAFDAVTMQPVTDQRTHDGPAKSADPCAWAAMHPAVVIPDLMAADMPLRDAVTSVTTPRSMTLRIASATGLPPATGPPALF